MYVVSVVQEPGSAFPEYMKAHKERAAAVKDAEDKVLSYPYAFYVYVAYYRENGESMYLNESGSINMCGRPWGKGSFISA